MNRGLWTVNRGAVFVLVTAAAAGCVKVRVETRGDPSTTPHLEEQASGTTALLQAVSAVNEQVVWVSGHRATWARTIDGGASWRPGAMSGRDSTLQFRDVHAVSAEVAYLLAAGPGEASRIYKTTDAGATWTLQFQNRDSSAFFDCFDFWDASSGIAVSDAVNGRMVVVTTSDGGASWRAVPPSSLPPALEGEGAFAASGTCLVRVGSRGAYAGTGAAAGARLYHTPDRGRTWSVVSTPVVSGQASGVASVAFRDERRGAVLGGRLGAPNDFADAVAITEDGGRTFTPGGRLPFTGAAYGAAFVPGSSVLVAAGPRGLGLSPDGGRTWSLLNAQSYWAVGFAPSGAGWAVGPQGRITRIHTDR